GPEQLVPDRGEPRRRRALVEDGSVVHECVERSRRGDALGGGADAHGIGEVEVVELDLRGDLGGECPTQTVDAASERDDLVTAGDEHPDGLPSDARRGAGDRDPHGQLLWFVSFRTYRTMARISTCTTPGRSASRSSTSRNGSAPTS